MSCFSPLVGHVGFGDDGKKKIKIISSKGIEKYVGEEFIRIPCGHCAGCRLDKARSWADRMMLELASNNGKAVFVTLTYNDDHLHFSEFVDLPDGSLQGINATLDVRDVQLFMKRLRKAFSDKRIRFFLSGEYGPQTFRPHYHAIIFGITMDDIRSRDPSTWKLVYFNKLNMQFFSNLFFEDLWSNGFVSISDVSYDTCGYVARYCTKKLFGELSVVYANRVPPFSLSSRRPGIGGLYLEQHPGIFDMSNLFVPGIDSGIPVPKYFLNFLKNESSELYDPELYDSIMSNRRYFAEQSEKLILSQTNKSLVEVLQAKSDVVEKRTSVLKRSDV